VAHFCKPRTSSSSHQISLTVSMQSTSREICSVRFALCASSALYTPSYDVSGEIRWRFCAPGLGLTQRWARRIFLGLAVPAKAMADRSRRVDARKVHAVGLNRIEWYIVAILVPANADASSLGPTKISEAPALASEPKKCSHSVFTASIGQPLPASSLAGADPPPLVSSKVSEAPSLASPGLSHVPSLLASSRAFGSAFKVPQPRGRPQPGRASMLRFAGASGLRRALRLGQTLNLGRTLHLGHGLRLGHAPRLRK
jgi:hypothetical protein